MSNGNGNGNGATPVSQRDIARKAIFKGRRGKSKIVAVFDTEIEVRSPALKMVLDAGGESGESNKDRLINLMISTCYVPGTSEQMFEDGDRDALLGLPFDDDMQTLQQTINEVMGVKADGSPTKDAEGNLKGIQPGTMPS